MLEMIVEFFGFALEIADSIFGGTYNEGKTKKRKALVFVIAILFSVLLVVWVLLTLLHVYCLAEHRPLIPLAVGGWIFLTVLLAAAVIWEIPAKRKKAKAKKAAAQEKKS